ncbi:MAG: phosphoadenylyl-sulfate reductase [Myxococcota bacterium]
MFIAESDPPRAKPDRLRRLAIALDEEGKGLSAADFLRLAVGQIGSPITLGTAFGAEGCALVHLVASADLPIDVFTLDTGLFFPETYELWRDLEARYGISIRAVRPAQTVAEQADTYGQALWERQPSRCCHYRKVVPLRGLLGGYDGWITGVRRGQSAVRREAKLASFDEQHQLIKLNPLVGWSNEKLDAFVKTHEIPINPLHAKGYPSIGCWPCTSPVKAGEDARSGRWRGHSKTECGIHDYSENSPT